MKKHCQKVKAEQTIETAVEDASKEAMTQGKDIAAENCDSCMRIPVLSWRGSADRVE